MLPGSDVVVVAVYEIEGDEGEGVAEGSYEDGRAADSLALRGLVVHGLDLAGLCELDGRDVGVGALEAKDRVCGGANRVCDSTPGGDLQPVQVGDDVLIAKEAGNAGSIGPALDLQTKQDAFEREICQVRRLLRRGWPG
jgi:hypothetical protein